MSDFVNVSFDPGINHTGYCVWKHGKPVELGTLNPPGQLPFIERFFWLQGQVTDLLSRLSDQGGGIDRVAVEDFRGYSAKIWESNAALHNMKAMVEKSKRDMIKCAKVAGMLLSQGQCFARVAFEQSKGSIKKEETALLAKAWKLKGSKDALDAMQIGVCSGFDKVKP